MTKPGKKRNREKREKRVSSALAAIKIGMSIKKAARVFSIPRSTLQYRLKHTKNKNLNTPVGTSISIAETVQKQLSGRQSRTPERMQDVINSEEVEVMMKTPASEDKKPLPITDLCRACMKSPEEIGSLCAIIPFDADLIRHYNTLTNLAVEWMDGLPQHLCKDCAEIINKYIEFRDNCIAVESSLQFMFGQELNADKIPAVNETVNVLQIKQEIKTEEDVIEDYYEPCSDHIDSDLYLEDDKEAVRKSGRATKTTFSEGIDKIEDIKRIKEKEKKEAREAAKLELLRTQCGICNQTAIGEEALNDHLKTHMNDKGCKCNLCSEEFERWPTLLVHRFTHIDMKKKDYHCHLCSKTHKSLLHMEFHFLTKHYDGEQKAYKCPLCSGYFRTIKNFKHHRRFRHPTDKSAWIACEFCSKTFYYRALYRKHVSIHAVTKEYQCDMCDYAAKTKALLTEHIKRKHNPSLINCNTCKRWHDGQQNYEAHRLECSAKHMTICATCGKQCRNKSCLQKHMQSHEAEPAFKCNLCPKRFRTSGTLRIHMDQHQGIKRFHCKFCDFRSYAGNVMIKHQRIHTGEKPYVCEICTKGFTGNNNLKVHMKVHGINAFAKKDPEVPQHSQETISR